MKKSSMVRQILLLTLISGLSAAILTGGTTYAAKPGVSVASACVSDGGL